MKREERRQAIMDLLVADRAVDLDALATRFEVSRMTIHRDLDDLAQAGLLRKVRGGATIEAGTQFESDFRIRELQDREAKARMAEAAMALVEPGMTVMVNDGSMAALLGARLAGRAPLTVITNNFAVIERLKDAPGVTLIALGGIYNARFNGFFGVVTESALAGLRADLAFVSTPAVAGLQAFHMDEDAVRTKRAMMRAAGASVLLVNHRRFGRSALHLLADLADFDVIVTDAPPAPDQLAALQHGGIALTIARTAPISQDRGGRE
ncbi:DeoR/GlpR family DNA-binding transcription regulator [Paracoccus bogoriensis]|uniref:DeoR/GlpR family DNA-binding transcription regulator n=1 Tax=Paracoccus bogoriensis TaxID=242065 RepID=UPI001C68682D|nr:DeoR/GlpR family DNA-binding transcription regulator [Paracoccus bogoriensis]MBW7056993.1 DeoR/GlpR family DNA-binding transcription regulator [Paracoccus bogoriensis]